jgi:hypothetical protein
MDMKMVTGVQLKPNERLSSISKDHHTRPRNGRTVAYIVEDKHHTHLIISQKLSLLVQAINEMVDEKPEQVSLTGLYQIIGKHSDRVGSFTKHRWKVTPYELDKAVAAFEDIRPQFQNAVLLGSKHCYNTVCV